MAKVLKDTEGKLKITKEDTKLEEVYWLVYNDVPVGEVGHVLQFGQTPIGLQTETGQPNLEMFGKDKLKELATRVDEIMGVGYYNENKPDDWIEVKP